MRDPVLEDSCGSYGLVVLLVPGGKPVTIPGLFTNPPALLADFSAFTGHIAQSSRLEVKEITRFALGAALKRSEPHLTLVWKSRRVVYETVS